MLRVIGYTAAIAAVLVLSAPQGRAQTSARPSPPTDTASPPSREPRAAASLGSGAIRGQVVDAATGRGLARVRLELNGGRPSGSAGEQSADDGHFEFRGLPPGRYSLQAWKAAYVAGSLPEYRLGRPSNPLEVAAGATLDNVIVRLTRASAITGRVLDRHGDPVEHARVSLRPLQGGRIGARQRSQPSQTQSNDIGEFRLAPVVPGSYVLSAVIDHYGPGRRPPWAAEPGFVAYPNVMSFEQAQPLVVAEGESLSDIELKLFPVAPVTVTGQVVGPDGQPAPNAMIGVGPIEPGEERSTSRSSTSTKGGAFELSLLPGLYELTGEAFDQDGGPGQSRQSRMLGRGVTRLAVAGERMDGVVVRLLPPRRVSGRIVFDGAGLAAPPAPGAIAIQSDGGQGHCEFSQALVNADLTFTITLSGERCVLGARATAGWSQRSITRGSDDLTDRGVLLHDDTALNDLVVTFTDRLPKLRAQVATTSGARASEFVVVIFPTDRSRWPTPEQRAANSWSRQTRLAGPGPDGEARVEGLRAGDYFVAAIDPDAADQSSPDFFERIEPLAARITLVEGEVHVVSLRLQPLP